MYVCMYVCAIFKIRIVPKIKESRSYFVEVGAERVGVAVDVVEVAHLPVFRTGERYTGPRSIDVNP